MTKGEGEGIMGGKKEKGHQGTCIQDPWAETMGVGGGLNSRRGGGWGIGRVMEGKWG